MNSRRFERLPVRVEDVARRVGYGLMGMGVGLRWEPRPVIVLSHMRAGSSLLSRVLADHAEIAGHGELHLAYRRPFDFVAARGKVAWVESSSSPSAEFWLDKILHPWLLEKDDWTLLLEQDPKIIFLLRRAEPTVRSLIGSFGMSESDSIDYYVSRAEQLAWFGSRLGERLDSVYVQYSDLTERTDATLELLGRYLELSTPLSARYGDVSDRGVDPSENLSAGVILRDDEKPVRHGEGAVVRGSARLDGAYRDARSLLSDVCQTV
ncbi:hypothetical protein [Ilumatobacter sp.]|uniref:hypothetical protein n=1 Tax=Ilumatobacter sp. TaxID=1967498 RepID=UPI003B52D36D